MKQLVLELTPRPEAAFSNFVPGRNEEALAALQRLAGGSERNRSIYLWGAEGSGRSHLLRAVVADALAAGRRALHLVAPIDGDAIAAAGDDYVVALDDVERLDATAQRALFALYNRLLAGAGALVTSGSTAPGSLGVRQDLATRLAWGLVYEVHALSDVQKSAAMLSHASARGFTLSADVLSYLLRHAPRDLHSLLALVDGIDRFSIEQQRAITVPLAREVLRSMAASAAMP